MEYFVCEAGTASALRDEVNHYIAKGWRPLGGVAVVNSNADNWWYYQAMVLLGPDGGARRDRELA